MAQILKSVLQHMKTGISSYLLIAFVEQILIFCLAEFLASREGNKIKVVVLYTCTLSLINVISIISELSKEFPAI